MYKCMLILLLSGISSFSIGQRTYRKNQKVKKDPFPLAIDYANGGWVLGGGLNYLYEIESGDEITVAGSQYRAVPIGKLGPTISIGRYYQFSKPFIFRFLDYGARVALLRGEESYEQVANSTVNEISSTATFGDFQAGLFLGINAVMRLNNYNFLTLGPGIYVNYGFPTHKGYELIVESKWGNPENKPWIGAYGKLGWGYKLDVDKVLWFTVDAPIYTLLPERDYAAGFSYFNNEYHPIHLTVNLLFFRFGKIKCPPVQNPNLPGNFQNGYGD